MEPKFGHNRSPSKSILCADGTTGWSHGRLSLSWSRFLPFEASPAQKTGGRPVAYGLILVTDSWRTILWINRRLWSGAGPAGRCILDGFYSKKERLLGALLLAAVPWCGLVLGWYAALAEFFWGALCLDATAKTKSGLSWAVLPLQSEA